MGCENAIFSSAMGDPVTILLTNHHGAVSGGSGRGGRSGWIG